MESVVITIVSAVLLWAAVAYNLLVRDRNRVSQAWSDVDVQLLRRHDLVPRLVEMVRGYAGYERALQTSLAELRSRGERASSPTVRSGVEKSVAEGVHRLVVLAEAYPDLKASENFLALHRDLTDTENQIQFARRYYNGAVNQYNNRTQHFPGVLIANLFGFRPAEFYDLEDRAMALPPGVSLS
jgi:LemA protein